MKKVTEDLFTFPIVMVDGENEERKESEIGRYGDIPGVDKEPVEYDIIYGEACYPYYDFIGAEDRWLPTQRSLQRAMKQKFDACIVRFTNAGQFLVPMNKTKFVDLIEEFANKKEQLPDEPKGKVTVIKFTPDMLADIIKKADEKEGDTDNSGEGTEGNNGPDKED